jgi:hypothetical protein
MKKIILLVLLIGCVTTSACSTIKPWQRGYLSKEVMKSNDVLGNSLNNHIYFSKEGSSGGGQAAGSGCGCN